MPLREETRRLNHDLLGPIFYRFFYKLYLGQRCQPQDETHLLFLSRGGIRLRAFYEAFLNANQLTSPIPYSDFYVSRMALIKASLRWSYQRVKDDFLAEYAYFTVDETMKAFLQPKQYEEWLRCEPGCDIQAMINPDLLDEVFCGTSAGADYLRKILDQEYREYQQYLTETVGDRTNLVAIDTGWSGSILKYMQNLDAERDYTALFFGRYNYGKPDPAWFNQVVGVEAQHPGFDRRFPITSIFLNRHLIEGLCEIRWPSVTGYKVGVGRKIEAYEGVAPEARIIPDENEPHAEGVLQYLQAAPHGMNYEAIDREADHAAKRLCRRLAYPGSSDLPLLSVPTRSADFGKNLDLPFFSEPVRPFYKVRTKLGACKDALWQAGQIAIEFGVLRLVMQFAYHHMRPVYATLKKSGFV